MSNELNNEEESLGCIIGAVVQLLPGSGADVRQELAAYDGVDIHAEDEQSRLVITMETSTSKAALRLTELIQNQDGVLSITPVYQHSEENQQQDQQGGWTWR